ncbi:MAG: hypothetical protein M1166_02990 [Candidatus Thermoplasmatota archaeon]|jgi:hypothetical protein|nr:hypothetical protein [Candidatus Thermoplasmatota archaeon]
MFIKDIDTLLDRQCIISFESDSEIAKILSAHQVVSIVRIRLSKTGGFAIYNFENLNDFSKEEQKILTKYKMKTTSESVMLFSDLSGRKFIGAFKQLNGVSSVVIDAVFFMDSSYFLYFRYHHNDEANVTSAIRDAFKDFKRFAVRYIGPNPGIVATFSEISQYIPLKYVEISSSVPPSSIDINSDPVIVNLGVSWYRELKFLIEEETRGVFYDNSQLLKGEKEWIHAISPSQRIYETTFMNPVVKFLIDEISKEQVVSLGMPQKLSGKDFYISTFVPDITLPEFFTVFYRAVDKFKDWKLDVNQVDTV